MSEQISKQFSLYEDVSLSTSDKTTPDNQERERIARDAFQYYLHNNVREKETATNPSGIFWIIADYVLQAKKYAVREVIKKINKYYTDRLIYITQGKSDFMDGVFSQIKWSQDFLNNLIELEAQ